MSSDGRRYFFALPEVKKPVGGLNILIQMANFLSAQGYDCRLLHATKGYRYGYTEIDVPVCFDPRLRSCFAPRSSMINRLKSLSRKPPVSGKASGTNTEVHLTDDDVIIVPEYAFPEVLKAIDIPQRVIVAQDAFGFMRAFNRDTKGVLKTAKAVITTSDASQNAVEAVSDRPTFRMTVQVEREGLNFTEDKKPLLTYMPRKRPGEGAFIASALAQSPEMEGIEIVPLQGLGQRELVQLLCDSLFFVSLSQQEGFGLPPAEAMRAGCITIGYVGVGGREYFGPDMGIAVPDDDYIGLLTAIRDTVAKYREDPAPFDEMRRHAAQVIESRYSKAMFEDKLRTVWSQVEASL